MNKSLTLEDCAKAIETFRKATDRAEQHQFIALATIDFLLESKYEQLKKEWDEEKADSLIKMAYQACRNLGYKKGVPT